MEKSLTPRPNTQETQNTFQTSEVSRQKSKQGQFTTIDERRDGALEFPVSEVRKLLKTS